MTTEPVSRPEFENALEGIRRELQAMGEHIGSDLAQIRAQLTSLLDVHHQEGREVGELAVKVEHVEEGLAEIREAHQQAKNNRWLIIAGVLVALVGHLINWASRVSTK